MDFEKKTYCKLTEDLKAKIIYEYQNLRTTQRVLVEKYGISKSQVQRVIKEKNQPAGGKINSV